MFTTNSKKLLADFLKVVDQDEFFEKLRFFEKFHGKTEGNLHFLFFKSMEDSKPPILVTEGVLTPSVKYDFSDHVRSHNLPEKRYVIVIL